MMLEEQLMGRMRERLLLSVARVSSWPTRDVTAFLTTEVLKVLGEAGLDLEEEHPLLVEGRRMRLDVLGCRGRRPAVAIEIDRSRKMRSLGKLRVAADLGALAVWVRWGRRIPSDHGEDVPAWLQVVELPLVRHGPRGGRAWSFRDGGGQTEVPDEG